MNKLYNPASMPPPASRYSQVVEIPGNSRLVVLSGQVGMRPDGTYPKDFEGQTEQAFENVMAGLAEAGMEVTDLVRLNTYVTRQEDVGKFRDIRDRFTGGHECGSTLVIVAGLASPDWLVEIEAMAAKA